MKWSSLVRPIVVWKEPRSFVLKNRSQPEVPPLRLMLFGWMQLRIMLYLVGALLIAWEMARFLSRFDPTISPLLFWLKFLSSIGIVLSGIFIIYLLPTISYWAPCFVRLYPHYLEIHWGLFFRYLRFGSISAYKFEYELNGWTLRLSDVDRKEELIAIPDDEVKMKVENAFSSAGVSRDGLTPAAVTLYREMDKKFRAQIKAYRSAADRDDWYMVFWLVGIFSL
jgi:hypothetical protein